MTTNKKDELAKDELVEINKTESFEEPQPVDVFGDLSKIDVSKYVEKKNNQFDYLNWGAAWALVKQYDPQASREYTQFDEVYINPKTGDLANTGRKVDYFKDLTTNTAYVECTVTIKGQKTTQSLPVTDFKFDAISNPKLDDVANTQQRCLVKALAMAGLGLNVYSRMTILPVPKIITSQQLTFLKKQLEILGDDKIQKRFVEWLLAKLNVTDLKELNTSQYDQVLNAIKKQVNKLNEEKIKELTEKKKEN